MRRPKPPTSINNVNVSPTAPADKPGGENPIEVTIRPLNLQRTTIKIRGISTLIMHAWSQKAIKMIEDKQQKKATGPRKAKDPQADFESARYRIDKNTDGIPAIALKACAVEAGVLLGLKKTNLRKSFFVGPDGEELIPIIVAEEPAMRRDMVRVGMGTSDVRYRPEYKDWSCEIPIEFNADAISADQLVNLFDQGGYSVGVGEWRPEKDGTHGRFRVVSE